MCECRLILRSFFANGDNKGRLFELIGKVWVKSRKQLGERVIYFSSRSTCLIITQNGSSLATELVTDHEEADTKIAYLIQHVARSNDDQSTVFVARSSSGDVDIPIILLGMEPITNMEIYIDNGSGKSKKLLHLNSCSLTSLEKKALVGFHA